MTIRDAGNERSEDLGDSEVLVKVDELRTYYDVGGMLSSDPVKAVDEVSFKIHRGETLGLVGESGCGKSTLGRTLIRLESATEGDIYFDGTDITAISGSDLTEWRKRSQMVFQDPQSSLNDRMTVGEIIREPLDVHDWNDPRDRRRRVQELLNTVGLQPEHYYRYPHQFSGGQRQRIGIARALALEPDFIVLDEPVSALDVSVQAQILNLLDDLQDEFGLTYLFIAHDLSVVRHICDRVAVMYLGHIMEKGETEDIFQNPENPYTKSLLSAIPEPDPTSDRDRIMLRGTPPSPRYPPAGCPFSSRCPSKIRPEEYRDLDSEVWDMIDDLREIARERIHMEKSVMEQVRSVLGLETRFTDVSELGTEFFDELQMPDRVEQHIRSAIEMMENQNLEEAQEYLDQEFGSVCNQRKPEFHTLDSSGRDTHRSFCHRHLTSYEDPDPIVSMADD